MRRVHILWADDEIDLLKPHILFLEQRGYRVTPVNNGTEAVAFCQKNHVDVVFLDEHMPGVSGLEALKQIKTVKPTLPTVMITQDEDEDVMEEAIGSQVHDYLIKPLNRNQVLSSIKKIIDNKRLIIEQTNTRYQQGFQEINATLQTRLNNKEWMDIYKKLVFWELQLDHVNNKEMSEILKMQKAEANNGFCRFIKQNYRTWLNEPMASTPLLSHQVIKKKVIPQIEKDTPCFLLVIENLRLDQWKIIKPILETLYVVAQDETYCSILPTATPYSSKAIFSGMLPLDMAQAYPDLYVGGSEEKKNDTEQELVARFIKKHNYPITFSYKKIKRADEGWALVDTLNNLFNYNLNIIVYNFIDMLSHARTDMKIIQELIPNESAYRASTRSWFEHSPLLDLLKGIAKRKAKLILTTDHGSIRVKQPCKIVGERDTNTNLRYKEGKNLNYSHKKVMTCNTPKNLFLPQKSPLSTVVFAVEDQFFVYPNKYNYHVNMYTDTFQHGGISLEEMIIPLVSLISKQT